MDFDGRVAIVTGAAGAIGSATAILLAERGATVVLADLPDVTGRVAEVGERCAKVGPAALPVELDLGSEESVRAMVAATLQRFGRLDALANIGGTWGFASLEETPDELWERILRVNLTGTFRCCRAALPALRESGVGAIVNIASGTAFRPVPAVGAYAASKGGVVAFSRVLAEEAAPAVRVNVVAPGPTRTPTHAGAAGGGALGDATVDAVTRDIPAGRMGFPEEIAEAIVFALSPRASFMTGSVVHVNGGRFMP